MSDISLFKPSMTIANSVPLSARQLDFFNFLLKGAYEQLEKNYVLDTFIFSYEDIKKFNPRLKSVAMIEEFFQEIYDKDFEFNILGKDSTVESNVKSRFITVIKKNSTTETVELGLEPLSISILRKMVMNKKGISIPGEELEKIDANKKNKKQKSHSYVYINITKELTFYPSKIVYELVHDYKNFIKEIDINDFKTITNTVDKYKVNYTNMVINKIQKDLEPLIKDFKIEAIKTGRAIRKIKITSAMSNNLNFEQFYENYLKEANVSDTIDNKKIAERIFKLREDSK